MWYFNRIPQFNRISKTFVCHSVLSWRGGLETLAGLFSVTVLLAIHLRPASLYHPQRRAIIHLKTQRRRYQENNKKRKTNSLANVKKSCDLRTNLLPDLEAGQPKQERKWRLGRRQKRLQPQTYKWSFARKWFSSLRAAVRLWWNRPSLSSVKGRRGNNQKALAQLGESTETAASAITKTTTVSSTKLPGRLSKSKVKSKVKWMSNIKEWLKHPVRFRMPILRSIDVRMLALITLLMTFGQLQPFYYLVSIQFDKTVHDIDCC